MYDDYPDEIDDCDFQDPGGRSALRASSKKNPRNLPCPTCGAENRLTPKDSATVITTYPLKKRRKK